MDIEHSYNYTINHLSEFCQSQQLKNPLILAVSKKKPIEKIKQLYHLGHRDFGENYSSELIAKAVELKKLPINWHFIGHIQSRQAKDIAKICSWVHSLDRLKVAEKLNENSSHKINVCIQINISNEDTKSGIKPKISVISDFIDSLKELSNLVIRGLMVIPSLDDKTAFRRTKQLFDKLQEQNNLVGFDTLSMGMSADYKAAIESGSTIIRLGTAIFGARK